MAVEYLVAAANEMFVILANNDTPSRAELTRAATLGCGALRQAADDPIFISSVALLAQRRLVDPVAFADITGRVTQSIEHFQYFLQTERNVMVRAGFDSRLVDDLSRQAIALIATIRQWEGNAEELLTMLVQMRDQACQLAGALAQEQQRILEHEATRQQVWRIVYGVAGAAMIALNAISSSPFSPAGTAVSGAVGSAFISGIIPLPH